MRSRKRKILEKLKSNPVIFARHLGFDLLTDLHDEWIKMMVFGTEDETLQAHRGSYKTTCVSVALTLLIILRPNIRTAFIRKTDTDVKEIIAQVTKMLETSFVRGIVEEIWGIPLVLTVANATEISTNLTNDPRGISQLVGMGLGGSITGKHFDRIFTDDIVNLKDRKSRAEREETKLRYQELINIKNRDGRIFNTGTPWHKEDAFTLMPNPQRFDCYETGLIAKADLEEIKSKMTASLFAANYELKHIADEDVIFTDPETGADPEKLRNARNSHIDAAYGGEDYTAFTILRKAEGKYYVYGRIWQKHVDECIGEIAEERARFQAGKIWSEDNADKGYLMKALKRAGEDAASYHESENKHVKIVTYLKMAWNKVIFVEGTDQEYINQICDYNEHAEHDDAPDSLATLIRLVWQKDDEEREYRSLFY
jgi:predicted phage terminase large subunit-like protein